MELEVLQGNEITCVYHRTIIDVRLQKCIQNIQTRGHKRGFGKFMNTFCDSRHVILNYTIIYVSILMSSY